MKTTIKDITVVVGFVRAPGSLMAAGLAANPLIR